MLNGAFFISILNLLHENVTSAVIYHLDNTQLQ